MIRDPNQQCKHKELDNPNDDEEFSCKPVRIIPGLLRLGGPRCSIPVYAVYDLGWPRSENQPGNDQTGCISMPRAILAISSCSSPLQDLNSGSIIDMPQVLRSYT